MKPTIIHIHGGSSFSSYDAFLKHLRTRPIWDPSGTTKKEHWRDQIFKSFGETCTVLYPSMPNSQNAKYEEWRIWFERYFEYVSGPAILIGHSLGGFFLAKYLTENLAPFPIKALYLVASPFKSDNFDDEDCADFEFDPTKLPFLEKQVASITIIHSKDDTIVPVAHGDMFHVALPHAHYMLFEDRGHFLDADFPEIIRDIQLRISK